MITTPPPPPPPTRHPQQLIISMGRRQAVLAAAAAAVLALGVTRVGAERHVAAGSGHVCVVRPDETAECFYDDLYPDDAGKTAVPGVFSFMGITAGDDFTCGLVTDGSVQCWGNLPGGIVPDPTLTFIDIHAGARHVCGLLADGTVLCYGDAASGVTSVPSGVYQSISTGTDVACAVGRDHTIICWGDSNNPIIVPLGMSDADHVSVGVNHACYVTTAGGVVCWGDDSAGQASVPSSINDVSAVWWLSAGATSTCAISGGSADNMTPPGYLECWGQSTGNWSGGCSLEVECSPWGSLVREDVGGGTASIPFAALSLQEVPIPRAYPLMQWVGDTSGYADGVGTDALLSGPSLMTRRGDFLYVTDAGNGVIRRINITSGEVTTVAGTPGVYGSHDDADPLLATFTTPAGIDADADGNLYVGDVGTYLIRKISVGGGVTTVAGQEGVLYGSPLDGVGTNAIVGSIYDMRYDPTSGIMYFTDFDNGLVRALYPNNNSVVTIATIGFSINALVLDPVHRTMYVGAEAGIYKVTYDGEFSLYSGGGEAGFADGPATAAQFNWVRGLEIDAWGNLYAADSFNNRVRKITPTGTATTLFGQIGADIDGVGTNAAIENPWGIRLDPITGVIWVVAFSSSKVRRADLSFTLPPAPLVIGAALLPPSPVDVGHQLMAWRALAVNPSRTHGSAVVDANPLTFANSLRAANTAGMNPAIRTMVLGIVALPEQAGAGPTDVHTFSTSARRGLHTLTLITDDVPSYALVLPVLETLNIASVAAALTITYNSFSGLPSVTCINCGATPALANMSGLGVRSSPTAGNLSLLAPSGLLGIAGLTALDLTDNALTDIQEHDINPAPYLVFLWIGNNPSLIHCAAFTAAKQPQLSFNNIDETGNPPSSWRAGCGASPSPVAASASPVPGASESPAPGSSASPVPGASESPAPGSSASPVPGASESPAPGSSASPVPGASESPAPGSSASPVPGASESPAPGSSASAVPGASESPAPGSSASPAAASNSPVAASSSPNGASASPVAASSSPNGGASASPVAASSSPNGGASNSPVAASSSPNGGAPSGTPTAAVTHSKTPTGTGTASISPSAPPTPSRTPSNSPTPSHTPSNSPTPSHTPSNSPTPSITPSNSPTPSITPSNSPTPSITPSNSPTPSITPSNSPTPSVTPSYTPTPSITPSNTPSDSATPSNSPTPSVTATASTAALLGAAASTSHKREEVAAAVLGVLAVIFILILLVLACRNPRCCCCCGAGRKRAAAAADEEAGKGTGRRLVLNLAGEEDSVSTAAAKAALDVAITVNSTGGGFVLYGGDGIMRETV